MTDDIMRQHREVVLRFTDHAIHSAWETYEPEQIMEQSDGSLLVTIRDPVGSGIIDLVLSGRGAVRW